MSFEPKEITNSDLSPAYYIKNTASHVPIKKAEQSEGDSSMDNVRTVSENFTGLTYEPFTTQSSFDALTIGQDSILTYMQEINNGTNVNAVNNVVKNYEEMKEKREILEEKMEEMEKEDTDINLQTESTIYTTLLITALGTSLLYYFFRKL
jgi:hypothetical protein